MPKRKKNKKKNDLETLLEGVDMVTMDIELTKEQEEKVKKYQKARNEYRHAVKKLRKKAKTDVLERLFA